MPAVEVIVVSGRGAHAASSAVATIVQQDYPGAIHILLVADNWDCAACDPPLQADRVLRRVGIMDLDPRAGQPTAERVARLRNMALSLVSSDLVCFLDDDNRWAPNHISSLVTLLTATGAQAVHSWRRIVGSPGIPWRGESFPWGRDPQRRGQAYRRLTELGIIVAGSEIFRDSFDACGGECPLDLVDMGSWLFRAEIFRSLRFENRYSDADVQNSITEDDKLLRDLRRLGIRTACTEDPSLEYRLGGFSNAR
jgi:hypothetical protein